MSDDLRFIHQVLEGYVLADEIDDFIDRWHDDDTDMELHDYLGLTRQEYSLFVEHPDYVNMIVAARKMGIPLLQAVNDNMYGGDRLAARADDGLALAKLKRWIALQPDRRRSDP